MSSDCVRRVRNGRDDYFGGSHLGQERALVDGLWFSAGLVKYVEGSMSNSIPEFVMKEAEGSKVFVFELFGKFSTKIVLQDTLVGAIWHLYLFHPRH